MERTKNSPMDQETLNEILRLHQLWLAVEYDGERANLRGADLSGADLRGACLCGADLSGADLRGACLCGADLINAYMIDADLGGADLRWADLRGSYLIDADMRGADLSETCLDPMNFPNGNVYGFELIDGGKWAIGYRTKNSPFVCGDGYVVGECYTAPVFSTDDTECHPGIYVCPTVQSAEEYGRNIIRVIFHPWDCHRAGGKLRVRELIVAEEIK